MTKGNDVARVLARRWDETAIGLPGRADPPKCPAAVIVDNGVGAWRFAYISLSSDNFVDLNRATAVDTDGPVDGYEVLMSGDIAVVVWRGEIAQPTRVVDAEFRMQQQLARQEVLRAQQGLGAVALEELSNPLGAPQRSIDALAAIWAYSASLVVDVAVEISLGADRQRYVDREFKERFKQRAPGLVARLSQHGVWSNPLLTLP